MKHTHTYSEEKSERKDIRRNKVKLDKITFTEAIHHRTGISGIHGPQLWDADKVDKHAYEIFLIAGKINNQNVFNM